MDNNKKREKQVTEQHMHTLVVHDVGVVVECFSKSTLHNQHQTLAPTKRGILGIHSTTRLLSLGKSPRWLRKWILRWSSRFTHQSPPHPRSTHLPLTSLETLKDRTPIQLSTSSWYWVCKVELLKKRSTSWCGGLQTRPLGCVSHRAHSKCKKPMVGPTPYPESSSNPGFYFAWSLPWSK